MKTYELKKELQYNFDKYYEYLAKLEILKQEGCPPFDDLYQTAVIYVHKYKNNIFGIIVRAFHLYTHSISDIMKTLKENGYGYIKDK